MQLFVVCPFYALHWIPFYEQTRLRNQIDLSQFVLYKRGKSVTASMRIIEYSRHRHYQARGDTTRSEKKIHKKQIALGKCNSSETDFDINKLRFVLYTCQARSCWSCLCVSVYHTHYSHDADAFWNARNNKTKTRKHYGSNCAIRWLHAENHRRRCHRLTCE